MGHETKWLRFVFLAVAIVLTVGAGSGRADSLTPSNAILPGFDLFSTQPGSQVGLSIPAGFFGPCSDPFNGTVLLTGQPIGPIGQPTTPFFSGAVTFQGNAMTQVLAPLGPSNANLADTIIQRQGATLPPVGGTTTIPIEIVGLSLVSINPITVTFGGGSPTPWNVYVSVNQTPPQTTGFMSITQTSANGGTFTARLPVVSVLTFSQLTSGNPAYPPTPTMQFSDLLFAQGSYAVTPEPGTLALFGLGLSGLAMKLRRRLLR
ncbi:MAG: PEP-CTERM sorting domain-containing protein [Acidobacteria bacterium]|nr:PEP-CTERM sorting domain-containing protein [Acidobacteriota bacterium]MBI3662263.1 PEP-CTERM sorting domain-containing protein [Acidobacteriota bacterium]